MSYIERHIGKLVPVNKNENQEKVALEILKTKHSKNNYIFDDYDNYAPFIDYVIQEFSDEYFLYNGIIYTNDYHIELEDDEQMFKLNDDDSIDYAISFYNGGTCYSEEIECGLENLLSNK